MLQESIPEPSPGRFWEGDSLRQQILPKVTGLCWRRESRPMGLEAHGLSPLSGIFLEFLGIPQFWDIPGNPLGKT